MIEYIFLFSFIAICAYCNRYMSKSFRLLCYCGIFIYIVLLFGLRYRVGIDTFNYMSSYSNLPNWSDFSDIDWSQSRFEPGYMLICMICRSFTSEFWLAQLVMAGITNICMALFLYRYCSNPFVGTMAYFVLAMLYFSTEIMRESAAIGIFLLNWKNLYYGKIRKYYFLCLLSISFHFSAIITLFFPLVHFLRINALYISICVGCIFIAPIFDTLNQLLTIPSIANRIDAYLLQAEGVNLNFRLFFLIYLAIPAVSVILLSYKKSKETIMTKFVLLHILLCCGVFAVPIIFSRFANYSLPFVIVSIANLLSQINLKIYTRVALFIFMISSQCLYYKDMFYSWVPYVSVLNPIKVMERENAWWYNVGQYRN